MRSPCGQIPSIRPDELSGGPLVLLLVAFVIDIKVRIIWFSFKPVLNCLFHLLTSHAGLKCRSALTREYPWGSCHRFDSKPPVRPFRNCLRARIWRSCPRSEITPRGRLIVHMIIDKPGNDVLAGKIHNIGISRIRCFWPTEGLDLISFNHNHSIAYWLAGPIRRSLSRPSRPTTRLWGFS